MVKLLLITPNIVKETECNTIILDKDKPEIVEVVELEGETKRVWKVKGKLYSKKSGKEKEAGVGKGCSHFYKVSKVEVIIDESDVYYKTNNASNYLYRKDTLKSEACKSCNSNDIHQFMDTLNGTK